VTSRHVFHLSKSVASSPMFSQFVNKFVTLFLLLNGNDKREEAEEET
jgi:hypothetical protein